MVSISIQGDGGTRARQHFTTADLDDDSSLGWNEPGRLVVCLFGVFGYVMGIGFFVTATLKVLHPDRVGLWVGPHLWDLSMGVLTTAELDQAHAHELLGWWLIPFGLIAGPLILVVTTLLLRWALRFAFPPTAMRSVAR